MVTELLQEIETKEDELSQLKQEYNDAVEKEKNEVLNSNLTGMKKSLYLLGFEFESSSQRTPQYLEFHRVFKREIKKLLKPYIKEIDVHKPNHFDVTGFFRTNNDKIFYFSVGDLRWDKEAMMIREAKDFKDYTGGRNQDIELNEKFAEELIKMVEAV